MKKRNILFFILNCLLMVLILTACVQTITYSDKLILSANKYIAAPGEDVILEVQLENNGDKITDALFTITQGAEIAEINDNVLSVSSSATSGDKIKLKASARNYSSNEIEIDVRIPLTEISISTSVSSIEVGGYVFLNKDITPKNADVTDLKWEVVSGKDICSIAGDILFVDANAAIGSQIKVKAVCGNIESNELSFTVGSPVSTVEISALSYEIVKGNAVTINVNVTPDDASEKNNVNWTIVQGGEYAEIVSNTLFVKSDAVTDAQISVKATVGGVESNTITFTVKATQQELNADKFMITVSEENIVLDKNVSVSPVLTVSVYNYNLEQVTDKTITFEIVEGSEYLSLQTLINDSSSRSLEALGHGDAVIRVGIEGYEVTHDIKVKVIVPPSAVVLPEVFTERAGFIYNFSKVNPTTSAEEKLPFVAKAVGENVCTDLKYTFIHENGESGDTVAVWNDGKISFKMTGKITVLVSSDSGSRVETTKSYTFNINEGYNVYSFVELQRLGNSTEYDGQPINIVVLEKPDGSALNYEYGFDLVPSVGLKAKENQGLDEIFDGEIGGRGGGLRINFVCKNVEINGNMHKIDLSQIRPITKAELEGIWASNPTLTEWKCHYAVISIIPWSADPDEVLIGSYTAKLRDLEIVGNASVDFDGDTATTAPIGVTGTGIAIGSTYSTQSLYYVDISNLKLSGLDTGLSMRNVVGNGLVEKVNISNCYHNGLEAGASMVRLKDLTFASCGSAAMELTPSFSNKVGENHDQLQTITFEGYINVDNNTNNGDTKFLQNYKIGAYTVPTVINGILSQYTDDQISSIKNANGEYKFICFTFVDFATFNPNYSVYNYPAYQAGGFINAKDLPATGVDTTHQYIVLDVDLSALSLGNMGTVLLYNMNYIPN